MINAEKIPWKRLSIEAAAIVTSILLAFAIDAWWDERVSHGRSVAQLNTLSTEFVEVQSQLQRHEATLLAPLEQYLARRKYVFIIINDKNIGLL